MAAFREGKIAKSRWNKRRAALVFTAKRHLVSGTAKGSRMVGRTSSAAPHGRDKLAAAAIARCLAGIYDGYLQSPLPERLTLLLRRIDEAEHGSRPAQARSTERDH
jgi:hypothetical protein